MNRAHVLRAAGCAIGLFAASAGVRADVVVEWQSTYQDIIRATGGAPCPVSRAGPIFSVAMFDAINSIEAVENFGASYTPYTGGLNVPTAGTSREAAAASAAYHSLTALHQGNAPALTLISNRYNAQLATIPDGAAKTAGLAHGQHVAAQLMAQRAADGFDGDPTYVYGGGAGDFRVTPDGPNVPAFSPHWGNCLPWGMASSGQFRPTRLTDYGSMANLLQSQEYADNINGAVGVPGVKPLGSRTSAERTTEQTEIAWFWANDRDGTYKPPGHLVEISKVVSANESLTLTENARMFALVNMAMADACIAAWDSKYNTPIDLWRPIDAIRETIDDGNAQTTADTGWIPLNDFTPPFPAYTSGHATMGAAHAGIMAALFGDNYSFTVGSDEFAVNAGLGYDPNLTRTFDSFSEAAWENALSRVYLGVHFYFDALDGNTLGYNVADQVFSTLLRPVPAPGAALVGVMAVLALGRRRRVG